MSDDVTCFVAYPAMPLDRAESIEDFVGRIAAGQTVDIIGWKQLGIAGRLLISTVCDAIRGRDVFIADVTMLNPNVLFELGYAIANRKRVWLPLNPHIERAKVEFDRFGLLSTIGYRAFSNSADLVNGFYSDRPFLDLEYIVYDQLLEAAGPPNKRDALFYVKPEINTDAVIKISRLASSVPMDSVLDEPSESPGQPLTWYAQQVTSASAVIVHFLSTSYEGWALHNAKHALVAGMAFGLNKPLLMLAHEPYVSPLDYRDLLRTHRTAREAEATFFQWITPQLNAYDERAGAARHQQVQRQLRGELQSIFMGDPIAEHESESVPDYFVSTAAYTEALHSTHSIFIGRKGTGKTATLYKLSSDLGSDPRNHLCVVRPVDYELEGVLAMLQQQMTRAEKGYLVESFWKFLLYTELARSIHEHVKGRPTFHELSSAEQDLADFVSHNTTAITPEFSIRLESAVERLSGLSDTAGGEARRARISEMLHFELISKLRELLGKALSVKNKVVILVDNLDKAWTRNADIPLLSELLYGLLSVSGRVADDFRRSASGLKPVRLHFTLFLRSDIYAAMLHFAKERDKLPVRKLTWDDPETLRSVIEERFIKSGAVPAIGQTIWDRYFCKTVNGMPVQDYLTEVIFPRPRDLVFLVKSALHFAVNRRNGRIEEKDIVSAAEEYSQFAFNSFLTEASARIPEAEGLLLGFLQAPEIFSEGLLREAMSNAQVPLERYAEVVDLLGELTFLGFEVSPGRFDFVFDEQNTQKIMMMAENTKNQLGASAQRFKIHPAFHAYLEVRTDHGSPNGQIQMNLEVG